MFVKVLFVLGTLFVAINGLKVTDGDLIAFGRGKLKLRKTRVISSRLVEQELLIEFDMYQSWCKRTALSTTAWATPVKVACSLN